MEDMILIWVIVVFIVDLSGVIDSIKAGIGRYIGHKVGRLKPIDCSLCMTFWTEIIYLICSSNFTIENIVIVCMMAFLSDIMAGALRLFKEVLIKIINITYDLFKL